MTARFQIRHRPDLSFDALVAIQMSGGAVLRSAHIGNWYPSNLNVAALGLRCVLTNTTTPAADNRYHPSGVIVGRRCYPGLCAQRKTPVSLATIRRQVGPPQLAEFLSHGRNLAEAHVDSLRKAVPQANVTTYENYALGCGSLLTDLLELCADDMPELWHRRLQPNGGVQDMGHEVPGESQVNRRRRLASLPRCWRDIARDGVYGVTDHRHGWLVPNAVMIVTTAVADAITYRSAQIFHLAGLDMYNYLDDMSPTLQRLYQAAMPRLRWARDLEFNLVPAGMQTLGAPVTEKDRLDHLVETWLAANRADRSAPTDHRDSQGHGRATHSGEDRWRARTMLAWAAAGCPFPFYDPREARYFSQYDLLVRGCEWYVHPWSSRAPLSQIAQMVRAVAPLAERDQAL